MYTQRKKSSYGKKAEQEQGLRQQALAGRQTGKQAKTKNKAKKHPNTKKETTTTTTTTTTPAGDRRRAKL